MTVSRPDPDEVAKFLQGELGSGRRRRVIRQLLSAWRVCRTELEGIWEGGRSYFPAPLTFGACEYDPAFEGLASRLRDRARQAAEERRRLPELIHRLGKLPPADQRTLVGEEKSFKSWLFGEWLIEESQRFLHADLDRSESLAACAVTVAEEIDPEIYGVPLVNDLKARAWACRGELLRLRADLRSAEEAFETAEAFAAQGSGDALEEARVLELKAALLRDQSRTEAAHEILDEVVTTYRQYRDFHLLGRAFIQKGRVHGVAGELSQAISWLRKGLGLIDPARERHVDLAARHSLMLYLNESGRPREARFLLKASRSEFLQHGSPLLICRLLWLEGKIYEALRFPQEAERALVEALRGFIEMGIAFSAATVSLDLAGLYAAQGRAAEVRSLAEKILPIFQSRDLQREAIGALIAFWQAASIETSSSRLLAEIRSHLDQARRDPKLRLEPA